MIPSTITSLALCIQGTWLAIGAFSHRRRSRPRLMAKNILRWLTVFLVLFEPIRCAVLPLGYITSPEFKLSTGPTTVLRTHVEWILRKPSHWTQSRWRKVRPILEKSKSKLLGGGKTGESVDEKGAGSKTALKKRADGGPALSDEQIILLDPGYSIENHLRTVSSDKAAAGGGPLPGYQPWALKPDTLPKPIPIPPPSSPPPSPPTKPSPEPGPGAPGPGAPTPQPSPNPGEPAPTPTPGEPAPPPEPSPPPAPQYPGWYGFPGSPGYPSCPGFPEMPTAPPPPQFEIGVPGIAPDGTEIPYYPGTPQWPGGPPYEPGVPGAPDYPGNTYSGPIPVDDEDDDADDGFDVGYPHGYPMYGTPGAPGHGGKFMISPQVPESVTREGYPGYKGGYMGAPDPPDSPGDIPGTIPDDPDLDPDFPPPNMPDPHAPGGKFFPPNSYGFFPGYYRPTYAGPPGGSTPSIAGTTAAQDITLIAVSAAQGFYILGDVDVPGSYTDYLRGVPGVTDVAAMDQFVIAVIKGEVTVFDQSALVFERIRNETTHNKIEKRAPAIMKQLNAPYHLGVGSNRTWTNTKAGTVYRWRDVDTSSVELYFLDTGINAGHVAFTGRVKNLDPGIKGLGSADTNGHGTHIAALAAGVGYGYARQSSIISAKVFDGDGNAYVKDIIKGVQAIIKHNRKTKKKAVLNMSFQGPGNAAIDRIVRVARRAGILVVVAAGNRGLNTKLTSPAREKSVLTVGASTPRNEYWIKSNMGKGVDIVAPGVDIPSAWIGSSTRAGTLSGTSMASPQVAGLAALYWSMHPHLNSRQIAKFIKKNASSGQLKKLPPNQKDRLLYNCVDLDCELEKKNKPFIRI